MSLLILQQPSPGGPGASYIQAGRKAIGSGVTTISVTFVAVFSAVPTVRTTVTRPANADLIQINTDILSITTTGFTAELSASTPTADYVLHWEASA